MWNDPYPASPGAGMLFFGLLTAIAVAAPSTGKPVLKIILILAFGFMSAWFAKLWMHQGK